MASGSWAISVRYDPPVYSPDTAGGIRGFDDDAPFFSFSNGQHSLISSRDGRVMYPNWVGSNATPIIVDAVFTPDVIDATSYDCINGNCIDSKTYSTSGLYKSLADCQAVCANGGACASGKQCVDPTTFIPSGKVCLDQGEFDAIEALISKINSEVC